MLDPRTLDLVADCLEYPGRDTAARARRAAEEAASDHVELSRALWDLAVALEQAPLSEAEERYTALFDLDPVCTLHVGYHLFGETYARGEFLAGLGAELRQAGLSPGAELPDFLPTTLRLLGRLGAEDRHEFLEAALVPGLGRMADALRDSHSPWTLLVKALPAVLAPRADGLTALSKCNHEGRDTGSLGELETDRVETDLGEADLGEADLREADRQETDRQETDLGEANRADASTAAPGSAEDSARRGGTHA